jgi:hypothetical protein
MDYLSLLQGAALRASEREAQRAAPTDFKWHFNYKVFVNPSVRCSWCNEWLPTKMVWVVDEKECRVRKLWTLEGERLDVEACHPHVGTAGAICMGDAQTVSEALFSGISNDAFIDSKPIKWFPEVLGHRCETLGEDLESEYDEDSFTCYGCDGVYHRDDSYYSEETDRDYCSDCFYESHTNCYGCGNDFYDDGREATISTPDGYYCQSCFSDKFFECEGCDEIFRLERLLADDRCEDCWSEKWETCDQCGVDFEREAKELNEDGLCFVCGPIEEEKE